jgi:flagellar biosynthesis/type III secretory pathway M-ring protein FliF/YscJ
MIAFPAGKTWATAMARYIVAFVLLTVIAGPVFAQQRPEENPYAADERQKKKDAEEIEKRYNSMLKNAGNTAAPTRIDPWQNMRGADDSKAKR